MIYLSMDSPIKSFDVRLKMLNKYHKTLQRYFHDFEAANFMLSETMVVSHSDGFTPCSQQLMNNKKKTCDFCFCSIVEYVNTAAILLRYLQRTVHVWHYITL